MLPRFQVLSSLRIIDVKARVVAVGYHQLPLRIGTVMRAVDLLRTGAEHTAEHPQKDAFGIEGNDTRVAVAIRHIDGAVSRVDRDVGRLVKLVAAEGHGTR